VENKETESTNMTPQKITIAILAMLFASLGLADDFKTFDGKEFKNATVKRVEPDGIVVSTRGGISKLYFNVFMVSFPFISSCFTHTEVMRKVRLEVTRKDPEMRKRASNRNARAQGRGARMPARQVSLLGCFARLGCFAARQGTSLPERQCLTVLFFIAQKLPHLVEQFRLATRRRL
jgi:hypothetical protein